MTISNEPDRTAQEEPELDDLERRLGELLRSYRALTIPERDQVLADLEQDLLEHECRRGAEDGAQEHPVLSVALGWEERLRRAARVEEADRVEHLAAQILIHGLRERERAALDVLEGPAAEIDRPTRDRMFDGLIAVEELRARVEGRAGALGSTGQIDARAVCDEAAQVQSVLRRALLRAHEQIPADAAARRTWTGRLVDLSDEAMLVTGERSALLCARILGEAGRAVQWHLDHIESGSTPESKRLKRRARRVESERVEQELQAKLERRFGARAVELWERAILTALLAIVVLLVLDLTQGPAEWRVQADSAVCAFLLYDFFVKATMVRFRWSWLRRHILTDFLPALPYAWVASLEGMEEAGRLSRLVRLVRITRIPAFIKLGLPIIRMFRAFNFLVRGVDRLVRRNAKLLESEVLLFPTPEERRRSTVETANVETRRWRLRSSIDSLFEQRLEDSVGIRRAGLAEGRLAALERAARLPVSTRDSHAPRSARRESLPLADRWLQRLGNVGSEEVEARLGAEAVRRIARGARLVARSPLRLAPLLGRWAPADAADLPDRRVASRSVRAIARSLRTLHGRVLWWADLHGTLTPGEVVGRVGATLVARTARPAVRLLLFGSLWLVVQLIVSSAGGGVDGDPPGVFGRVFEWVNSIAWNALVILGSICLALLSIGVWLQRLARDTTTYHEQVARAQFLHLTDSIKARARLADARLIAQRVFLLERQMTESAGAIEATLRDEARFLRHLESFLAEGNSPPSMHEEFDPVARAVMLHRDLLDGALLTSSDTRATSQLLGNLAIQRMARDSNRVGAGLRKAMRAIDLERRNTFLRGPYLWFHSISRALSSRAARLIVDYNAHAVPLAEKSRITKAEEESYGRWLARDGGSGKLPDGAGSRAPEAAPQLTTAFTVLHFLDDSPVRDAEIESRFGAAVVERMRQDRRALIRTVFGTYPLHRAPVESRVLNLRALYGEWVEGGRILLFPFRAIWLGAVLTGRGLRKLVRAVGAIRRPELALLGVSDAEADFTAAARKIGRMRAPGALAGLHLRAILDPEYHGLGLPFGGGAGSAETESSDDERATRRSAALEDAEFLGADPEFLDQVASLRTRAIRNVGRIEKAAAEGLLERIAGHLGEAIDGDAETLRALVVLIHADDGGLRAGLFGLEVLSETVVDALEFGLPAVSGLPATPLWLRFDRWWRHLGGRKRILEDVEASGVIAFELDAGLGPVTSSRQRSFDRGLERRIKRAAWRVIRANTDGALACFEAVYEGAEESPLERRHAAERRLADALRHPARVTEQIATLRTVQTLALVDVRNYRRQVWSLGQYADEGDPGGVYLDLPAGPSTAP